MKSDSVDQGASRKALAPGRELQARESREKYEETTRYIANLLQSNINNKNPTPEEKAAIQKVFADFPEMWTTVGDMMRHAIVGAVDSAAPGFAPREAMLTGCNIIRDQLGYKGAPMIEQLLIRHVVLCWLRLSITENLYNQVMSASSLHLEKALYWEKKLNLAQGRYLKATEMLAKVRKLSTRTPLQVNIGGQQINMVNSNAAAEG